MSLKIVLLSCLVIIATLSSSDGQYMCEYAGLTGQKVSRKVPASATTDTCSRSVLHSCAGDMCQSYVQCKCSNSTISEVPPGIECWKRGEKVATPDGFCNTNIPIGTAVAAFDQYGKAAPPSCGAFMGCEDSTTIKVFLQNCIKTLGIVLVPKASLSFDSLYVILADDPLGTDPTKIASCGQRSSSLQPVCSVNLGLDLCKT